MGLETGAVAAFEHVNELVDEDVFEQVGRLLGQLQVEPDAPSLGIARPPPGLHSFDAPRGSLDADYRLPLRQQGRDLRL